MVDAGPRGVLWLPLPPLHPSAHVRPWALLLPLTYVAESPPLLHPETLSLTFKAQLNHHPWWRIPQLPVQWSAPPQGEGESLTPLFPVCSGFTACGQPVVPE